MNWTSIQKMTFPENGDYQIEVNAKSLKYVRQTYIKNYRTPEYYLMHYGYGSANHSYNSHEHESSSAGAERYNSNILSLSK